MNSYTPRYHGYRFPPAIISHDVVGKLFRIGHHLMGPVHHPMLRSQAFGAWQQVLRA